MLGIVKVVVVVLLFEFWVRLGLWGFIDWENPDFSFSFVPLVCLEEDVDFWLLSERLRFWFGLFAFDKGLSDLDEYELFGPNDDDEGNVGCNGCGGDDEEEVDDDELFPALAWSFPCKCCRKLSVAVAPLLPEMLLLVPDPPPGPPLLEEEEPLWSLLIPEVVDVMLAAFATLESEITSVFTSGQPDKYRN